MKEGSNKDGVVRTEEEKRKFRGRGADGLSFYGDNFDGVYMKLGECLELLPAFKAYYFQEKNANIKLSTVKILISFNQKIEPVKFYPYPKQYMVWRKKWDVEILRALGFKEAALTSAKRVRAAIRLRDEENQANIVPSEDELDGGARTLGGMLVNDAIEMFEDNKEMADAYSSSELMKRKAYTLNVFAHISKHVQGKEVLKIKKHAEGRETAGFMMNLIHLATSGKMTAHDMEVMRVSSVKADAPIEAAPIPLEQPIQQTPVT